MTKTIATRFAANETDRNAIVKDACREAKGMRVPFERKALIAYFTEQFCLAYECAPKPKDRGEGFTWPTRTVDGKVVRTKAGDTAKKACERLVDLMLGGKADREKEEIDVPEELLQAAAKLAQLCAKREWSRAQLSKAIATAFAKG